MLNAQGLGAQPEPSTEAHILCKDFATFGVMIVLEGTPPWASWVVYQYRHASAWHLVQAFAPDYGKTIKILENGDVLQEGAGNRKVTWHWRDARFFAVRVEPPLIASTCSFSEASEVAFRTGVAEGISPEIQRRFVICDDFSRYGVMVLAGTPSAKTPPDSIAWEVYRKLGSTWQKVQDLPLPNSASLRVANDGTLIEEDVGNYQRFWRWNGSNFIAERRTVANIPEGCSFASARHVNAEESGHDKSSMFPSSPKDVLCQDYKRYGVMIFRESAGSDVGTFAIYHEQAPGKWKKLKSILLDNAEVLAVLANGDLMAQNDRFREIYHWNGTTFSNPEKTTVKAQYVVCSALSMYARYVVQLRERGIGLGVVLANIPFHVDESDPNSVALEPQMIEIARTIYKDRTITANDALTAMGIAEDPACLK